MFSEDTRAIIECLLFVSNEPLTLDKICEIVGIDKYSARKLLEDIKSEFDNTWHGFNLTEIAEGFLFITKPEYKDFIEKLYKPQLNSLSHAGLETLSIIAYKQPITRSEIELIRGVKVDKIVSTLVEKNLIEELGRKDAPGRPIIYGTTKDFLKYFGLKNINELPPLGETYKKN